MIETRFYELWERKTEKYAETYNLFKKKISNPEEKVLDEKRGLVGLTSELKGIMVEITNRLRGGKDEKKNLLGSYNLILKGEREKINQFVEELDKDYGLELFYAEESKE